MAFKIPAVNDYYCQNVFSGKVQVKKVIETENVLAYHHTRPFWPTHIVVVPKKHVESLLTIEDETLMLELINVIKKVAEKINNEQGACRVLINLGNYQDSKHLHFHVCSGEPLR